MNDALFWTDADGTAHERCQLLFVSTGESVDFDPGAQPLMRWPRSGWAFYCPVCVEIWERIIQLDSRGQQRASIVLSVACAKHTDSWNLPGSILAGELEHLLPLLPEGIARREFALHLQEYEQGEMFDNSSRGRAAAGGTGDLLPDRREGVAGGSNRNG